MQTEHLPALVPGDICRTRECGGARKRTCRGVSPDLLRRLITPRPYTERILRGVAKERRRCSPQFLQGEKQVRPFSVPPQELIAVSVYRRAWTRTPCFRWRQPSAAAPRRRSSGRGGCRPLGCYPPPLQKPWREDRASIRPVRASRRQMQFRNERTANEANPSKPQDATRTQGSRLCPLCTQGRSG